MWRCYAADKHSKSIATWKIHVDPLANKEDGNANQSKFPNKTNKKTTSVAAMWRNKTAFQK